MHVDWYYDLVSPYCYLQLERLGEVAALAGISYRPVLFAALLEANGQRGPAEIPAKRRHTYRQVQWLARRQGIPLRFPPAHPFNPLRGLRLAIAAGNRPQAVRALFRHVWRDGRTFTDADDWRSVCEAVGVPDADARIELPAVKAELRANGERAIHAGVFGVPTAVVGDEQFWGADATPMLLDYLRDPRLFEDPEYRRLDALPVGVTRSPGTGTPTR